MTDNLEFVECIAELEAQLAEARAQVECEPLKSVLEAQEGYENPIMQVAFRAGFIFCREIMARFVEQGGDTITAASIRANWLPQFGDDPGCPRQERFDEVAQSDDMENGPWKFKNPGASVEGASYALTVMVALGMELPKPRALPDEPHS